MGERVNFTLLLKLLRKTRN